MRQPDVEQQQRRLLWLARRLRSSLTCGTRICCAQRIIVSVLQCDGEWSYMMVDAYSITGCTLSALPGKIITFFEQKYLVEEEEEEDILHAGSTVFTPISKER